MSSAPPSPPFYAVLFDANARDRRLAIEDIGDALLAAPDEDRLLWVDLNGEDPALMREVCERLDIQPALCEAMQDASGTPGLRRFAQHFVVQAVAVEHCGQLEFSGLLLNIAFGGNLVLTVHPRPLKFIAELRAREDADSSLGVLSAESFTASLLDWQLSTYFDAVSDFEAAVERLEVGILAGHRHHRFAELHALRKGASRLRRMLAPHRRLFAGLARPDFHPRADGEASIHFQTLDTHYERAMDMVENARDLVVGSFELFTSQTAWRTNRTMRTLTFFTVLLGALAVIAGLFGMNFETRLFESGDRGFWIALASMGAIVVVATAVARARRWL